MKYLIFIVALSSTVACQQLQRPQDIGDNRLLYVYDLKFSAYRWLYDTQQWVCYLPYYLTIDKKGHFQVLIKDSLSNQNQFYEGNINDSTRLLLDSLLNQKLDLLLTNDSTISNLTYDGLTYRIDFQIGTSTKQVVFKSYQLQNDLQTIMSTLYNVAKAPNIKRIDTIDVADYVQNLKISDSTILKQIPRLEPPIKVY
jgi:hypothetical protein